MSGTLRGGGRCTYAPRSCPAPDPAFLPARGLCAAEEEPSEEGDAPAASGAALEEAEADADVDVDAGAEQKTKRKRRTRAEMASAEASAAEADAGASSSSSEEEDQEPDALLRNEPPAPAVQIRQQFWVQNAGEPGAATARRRASADGRRFTGLQGHASLCVARGPTLGPGEAVQLVVSSWLQPVHLVASILNYQASWAMRLGPVLPRHCPAGRARTHTPACVCRRRRATDESGGDGPPMLFQLGSLARFKTMDQRRCPDWVKILGLGGSRTFEYTDDPRYPQLGLFAQDYLNFAGARAPEGGGGRGAEPGGVVPGKHCWRLRVWTLALGTRTSPPGRCRPCPCPYLCRCPALCAIPMRIPSPTTHKHTAPSCMASGMAAPAPAVPSTHPPVPAPAPVGPCRRAGGHHLCGHAGRNGVLQPRQPHPL